MTNSRLIDENFAPLPEDAEPVRNSFFVGVLWAFVIETIGLFALMAIAAFVVWAAAWLIPNLNF